MYTPKGMTRKQKAKFRNKDRQNDFEAKISKGDKKQVWRWQDEDLELAKELNQVKAEQ